MATQTFSAYHTALTALDNTTMDQTADSTVVYDNSATTEKKLLLKYIGAGLHSLVMMAAGMKARTTNGATAYSAEKSTNKVMIDGLSFDASTAQYAQFQIPLPKGFNSSGSITATFQWSTAATAGTGNVIWGIQMKYERDDDALDAAFGTAQTVTDGFLADGDMHVTAATSAITPSGTYAAGSVLRVQVYRDAANGSDTYTQAAILESVKINLPYSANTDD
ncbi:MAG TPA: hypothetical protein PLF26_13075 [Blastocatellia bacterium]|nr:hypothetical protein [Blastocatellia bacterium]